MGTLILIIIILAIVICMAPIMLIAVLAGLILYLCYHIYEIIYFKSEKFTEIKLKIKDHIKNCNELNSHIQELKTTYVKTNFNKLDYGSANFVDSSRYKYKRPELKNKLSGDRVYHCSKTVASNAEQQPFKYLCKYFDIKTDEKTLEDFENILNNFSAAENGKQMLLAEKKEIIESIKTNIPFLIKKFSMKKLEKKLGFEEIDLSDSYFPKFVFQYVSPAGNSSFSTEIRLDVDNMERFIKYLAEKIKFKKTIEGQRRLMTQKLRQEIKERDHYTCKACGVSIIDEPHLLLEIDHIIPISKGGLTEESNLQTLCWKCNRQKSNKVQ